MSRRSFTSRAAASAANWRSLVWGDAFQERVGIERAVQPVEPIDPQLDCLWCCRAGRLLEAIEAGGRAVGRLDQQGFQYGHMLGCQACRDQIKDPPMNFRAKSIHQPVERAERGKVDRSRVQCLDRSVDEVSRVAHGLCRLKRGAADQTLACLAIGGDGKMRPDCRLVAVQRLCPALLIGRGRRNAQVHLRSQIRDRVRVDFVRCREVAEVLAGLQQGCEQHASAVAASARTDKVEVRVAQAVSSAQLVSGQPRTRPRVRSAVDGRHGGVQKRVRRSDWGKRMI